MNKFDFSEVKHKADMDAIKYLLDLPEEYAREKNTPRLDLKGVSGSLTDQFETGAEFATKHNAEITTKTREDLERN